MEQFREGHINILVATDLAAEELTLGNLICSQPPFTDVYCMNTGRTARAGEGSLS
jgi:ATP-dependent RNA helicase DeaD